MPGKSTRALPTESRQEAKSGDIALRRKVHPPSPLCAGVWRRDGLAIGPVLLSFPGLFRLVLAYFFSQNTIKSVKISRLLNQPNSRAAAGGGSDVFCWAVGLAAAVPGWDDGRQGAPIYFLEDR